MSSVLKSRVLKSLTLSATAAIGISLAIAAPTALPTHPAQAQAFQPTAPSKALRAKIIAAMQQELGGTAQNFTITQITPTQWDDCALTGAHPASGNPCQPGRRRGWQVQVKGRGELWTYYATARGDIQLDGPASVNPEALQTLVRTLGYDPAIQLKILAARPLGLLPDCPTSSPNRPCNAAPQPHWQILLEQQPRPLTISLKGTLIQPSSLRSWLPKNLAGLAPLWAEAVLHDVRDRNSGILPPNFQIESIRKTTWAACDSGGLPAPGPGPSQQITGACLVGTTTGWQMITRSGPVRWVHYVQPGPLSPRLPGPGLALGSLVSPDGPQSLPQSVADLAIAETEKQERQPRNSFRVHWAQPVWLDACLNPAYSQIAGDINPALSCRQNIQSGWQVQVMGGQVSNGMQRLWTYHTSLTGHEWRLISVSNWAPPPVAPPPPSNP